jgi:hypothetical protein
VTVRIVGIVIGVLVLALTLVLRSRQRLSRGDTLLWMVAAGGTIALSVAPALADLSSSLFRLPHRLSATLVVVTGVMAAILFRTRSRLHHLEVRFGSLVRNDAVKSFQRENEDPDHRDSAAVVIAAFNEEQAIGGVLHDLPPDVEGYTLDPIIVVDGGDDDTEGVVRRAGYSVATHGVNRGQGDALRTGFAIALQRGADIVITMDADGQHRPDQLEVLLAPLLSGEADYVQGSRFLGDYDDAGGVRDVGIKIFTKVINLLGDTEITDCTNGFRAIRAEKLALLDLREDRFNGPEIIMESAMKGLRMIEVPVHIRRRSHGESKKPARLGYPLGFLATILKVWLRS